MPPITCVDRGNPRKNRTEQTRNRTTILFPRKTDMFSSMIAVMTVSMVTNWVLSPSMMIIRKNRMDHSDATGK